ncbi:MAG: 50S ribosomal protein L3 [Nanoarchaeota archaeon]|nr:50S ribosomal protein L3 [Nanoarchaeota archaeon]
MGSKSAPRRGSLQFYPRKRSRKFLPRVNWTPLSSTKPMLGFIGYKVAMASMLVKDSTADSLTKNKNITIPVTILEIPPMKIYSVRFYKDKLLTNEIILDNPDKELKKLIKLPKDYKIKLEDVKPETFDDLRVMAYSLAKKTSLKKKPDMTEFALSGDVNSKLEFIKNNIGKEISGSDILTDLKLVDIRALTRGKGLVGPVKRFGIGLKSHKSEKGVRRPGNVGPFHPARVSFRVPMAGQLGMFTRAHYNKKILQLGKISEKDINPQEGFRHFGKIKTDYVILEGSVQGPVKRQVLLTAPLRPTKKQEKKNYEVIRLV